jgi:hypothetical protein
MTRTKLLSRIAAATAVSLSARALATTGVTPNYAGSVLLKYSPSSTLAYEAGVSYVGPGQISGDGMGSATGNLTHALVFNLDGTYTDLNPTAAAGQFSSSFGLGGGNGHEVGYVGGSGTGYQFHAYAWTGTLASAVDLNGTATSSEALGCNATYQVGVRTGVGSGYDFATVWKGNASSAVNLNTGNMGQSEAVAVSGNQQVGDAELNGVQFTHAFMWSLSAGSAIDLNPTDLPQLVENSYAKGTDITQQVGDAQLLIQVGEVDQHAIVWTGSANSAVDLNPAGASGSDAVAVNDGIQAGNAEFAGGDYAYAWSGTAASGVNLNSDLPGSDTWVSSSALSVDSSGNIYGTATDAAGNSFAVQWTAAVPEPATMLLAAAPLMALRRRRHNPRHSLDVG